MTTAQKTVQYIKENPAIQSCLKKGLINYSALSRLISKELKLKNNSSLEAILVAARRYQETLKKNNLEEKKIKKILESSELDIKSQMKVLIVSKSGTKVEIEKLEKQVRDEHGVLYVIEGSDCYTLIGQKKHLSSFKGTILKKHEKLALVNLKTPQAVESTPGVISYLTSLFAEQEVNIVELLSCWKDTLFLVEQKDLAKVLEFIQF